MKRIPPSLFGLLVAWMFAPSMAEACRFTPLEWQQPIEKHGISAMVGQRKHTTWNRDRNRNFIDDEIEKRFRRGEIVNIIVDTNKCLRADQIRAAFSPYGKISYIGKLITFVLLENVRVDDLPKLAAHPDVAMIEWQETEFIVNDVSTRAIQARTSNTFSPNTAQDAGFTGTGVTIAILDTGVTTAQTATKPFRPLNLWRVSTPRFLRTPTGMESMTPASLPLLETASVPMRTTNLLTGPQIRPTTTIMVPTSQAARLATVPLVGSAAIPMIIQQLTVQESRRRRAWWTSAGARQMVLVLQQTAPRRWTGLD